MIIWDDLAFWSRYLYPGCLIRVQAIKSELVSKMSKYQPTERYKDGLVFEVRVQYLDVEQVVPKRGTTTIGTFNTVLTNRVSLQPQIVEQRTSNNTCIEGHRFLEVLRASRPWNQCLCTSSVLFLSQRHGNTQTIHRKWRYRQQCAREGDVQKTSWVKRRDQRYGALGLPIKVEVETRIYLKSLHRELSQRWTLRVLRPGVEEWEIGEMVNGALLHAPVIVERWTLNAEEGLYDKSFVAVPLNVRWLPITPDHAY